MSVLSICLNRLQVLLVSDAHLVTLSRYKAGFADIGGQLERPF